MSNAKYYIIINKNTLDYERYTTAESAASKMCGRYVPDYIIIKIVEEKKILQDIPADVTSLEKALEAL